MSVKIGIAPGNWTWQAGGSFFFQFVDACEKEGWDSLWLTDRLVSERRVLEPVTALAAVAARTQSLKFGTSVLIPSLRNPTVLAKELATVDFLAGGRLLPAVGLGSDNSQEYEAAGVEKRERRGRTEEAIGLLRRLWTEDHVTHHGRFYTLNDVTIEPKPLFRPTLPIWIGGRTDQAHRRVARLGDGWLVSSVTPEEAAQGVEAIHHYLDETGRTVEEDHYGLLLGTYLAGSREKALAALQANTPRPRPDVPLETYTAAGTPEDIHEAIRQYRASGISKFVLRLSCAEEEALEQLHLLAEAVAVPVNTGRA